MQKFPCPCCGFYTLEEMPPGTFILCSVCCWEDDPVQYVDPDYQGGANFPSLNEARENFRRHGTSDILLKHLTREPHLLELPEKKESNKIEE